MTNEELDALFFQRIQKAAEVLTITQDKLRRYLEDAGIYTDRGGWVYLNSNSLTYKNLTDMLRESCDSKKSCQKAAYILKGLSLQDLPEDSADLIILGRDAPKFMTTTIIKGDDLEHITYSKVPDTEEEPKPKKQKKVKGTAEDKDPTEAIHTVGGQVVGLDNSITVKVKSPYEQTDEEIVDMLLNAAYKNKALRDEEQKKEARDAELLGVKLPKYDGRVQKKDIKIIDADALDRYSIVSTLGGHGLEHIKASTGDEFWYKNGSLHRLEGPARIHPDGTEEYWVEGTQIIEPNYSYMRVDTPTNKGLEHYEDSDGNSYWTKDGTLHREDGPSYIDNIGSKFWYLNGKLSRENGPAQEFENGDQFWYKNGLIHREDGPAVKFADGGLEWRQNNGYHREDGPAVINADGTVEYWEKGVRVAPPVEKVSDPVQDTPDPIAETLEERLEERSPETYELHRRIYKAAEIMDVTATKLQGILSVAGIDVSPDGMRLLDSDAITVQDLVDVIEVGHLSKTINIDGVPKEVPVPVLKIKAAAHALKSRVPDFMESTKGEAGTLTISGPEPAPARIKGEKECREDSLKSREDYLKNLMGSLSMFKTDIKQMRDADLLKLYLEDQSYEIEQELHRRSQYKRFIVLGSDKKIDFEVSLDLLKRCRKMVIPTVIPVNGSIVPVYRITELNPEENLVELCPICGAVTYKGYCDKCQIDFGPVGDVERYYAYLVSKHANFNAGSFSDRRALVASAMKGLEDLKGTWPSVIKNFEELQLTNSLPSLKKIRELPCVVKPSDPFNISK